MGVGKSPRRHHLNVHTAFEAYESVRGRLPSIRRSTTYQTADNLGAISHLFDAFLLDAFGVLNIGETAIPGAPERVAGLQRQGKRVLVVSNAASVPRSDLRKKYAQLGFDFAPEDIVTSRMATLEALISEPERHWGLMLPTDVGHHDIDHINFSYLADDPGLYDNVEGFLLLGSGSWSEDWQALLENALQRNPRPVLVGNPDIVAPREYGFSVEPGYYAHGLADRTGIEPIFFGKPFSNIFELARARTSGTDPARTLMVGDSLHTDILGGQAAGLKTALITEFGFFGGLDPIGPINTSGIQPDYLLRRP